MKKIYEEQIFKIFQFVIFINKIEILYYNKINFKGKIMFAVIFEVEINQERKDEYLKIASILKEQLVNQKGFISVERFQSLIDEKKLLSLSYWEDEEAILAWKKNIDHMSAQKKGRESIFKDYKINIAKIQKSYTLKTSDFDK